MNSAANNRNEGIGILGVLALIVESWWVLIGLPIVFAAIACAMVYLAPARQTATAQVAVVTNDPALSCIAARLRVGAAADVSCTTALAGLITLEGIDTGGGVPTISIENKDRGPLVTVSITGSPAEHVAQGALAVVTALRSFEPEVLANYDRTITVRKNEIEQLRNAVDVMQANITNAGSTATERGLRLDAAANAMVLIHDTLDEKQDSLDALEAYSTQALELTTKAPVISVVPVPRDLRLIIAAFLVGTILAAVTIYMRYILGIARNAPDYAEKRDRIVRAIPFWRKN